MWWGKRIERVEQVAEYARKQAEKALADNAAHTAVCMEKHKEIDRRLGVIETSTGEINRILSRISWQIILLLVMALAAMVFQIARSHNLL